MKTRDFVKELNNKSVDELNNELVAAKKELFNLRFQNATNQLENTSRIKEVRRNIAEVYTRQLWQLFQNSSKDNNGHCIR